MEANVTHLRQHRVVLWSKHGVMARSAFSATQAADLIEYVETAAGYEYMDLVNASRGPDAGRIASGGSGLPCFHDPDLMAGACPAAPPWREKMMRRRYNDTTRYDTKGIDTDRWGS
jgi:hypothetical protein